MKNIKSNWFIKLAFVITIAFSAASCLKEDALSLAKPIPQGEMISFNIQQGWNDTELTKSSATSYGSLLSKQHLVSEDKSESMGLGVYQQPNTAWFEPETRGSMVSAAAFNEFMAFGYKTTGTTTTRMFTTYHQKGGTMWEKPVDVNGGENANGYYWPGADYTCSFFGIAMSDNKLTNEYFYSNVTTTTNDAGQIVSFDYTVPTDATDQPDIMVASATNLAGDGSQGATLNFKHILTAINIKVGETMQNGTIESITFKNIYGKGTYTLESGVWSGLREFNQLHDYTVNLGTGFSTSTTTQPNTQVNAADATFMVIPQTLSANAEIEIMFKHAGTAEAISIKGSLAGSSWPQGRVVSYLINVKPDGNLVFTSNVIAQDAHYVIVPLTIKANNLSDKGWTMESDNPAVTLKSELSTLQQQGLWTENELGGKTLTSKTTGNVITVYAFLEENLTDANRNFTLSLKNTATGEIVDTKTITQLCMSSARSERIEETSYVPWGFKWDRKVVYHAKPDFNIWNFNIRDLFAAVLFNSIGEDIKEKYPEAVESGVLTVTPNYQWIIFANMNVSTDITIDYGKLDNLNGVGESEDSGHVNTEGLYYYKGISSISDLETLLDDEKSSFSDNAISKVVTGSLDDVSYVSKFAAKSCVMKNRFWAETIKEEAEAGTVEYQIPVLSSDETSRTDDNFNYLEWYLPAKDQYSLIETAETNSNYQLNGVYWTSTAVSNDNVNSYIYTPGGTGVGTDDRMKTHLVRCMRKVTQQ